MKKKLLQILSILLLLNSCNPKNNLEGLWQVAYQIIDDNHLHMSLTRLLEFEGEKLYTITIRDEVSGDLSKITIDSTTFRNTGSKLYFDEFSPGMEYFGDSIILHFGKPNYTTQGNEDSLVLRSDNPIYLSNAEKLVLKRLPTSLKNLQINPDYFKGSFKITSPYYRDSLDFIHDSLLIYTGSFEQHAYEWQIVDYKGYKFFNIHRALYVVPVIQSCNQEEINLLYRSTTDITVKMTPSQSLWEPKLILGKWKEIKRNTPPPPLILETLTEEDLKYSLRFKADSLEIKYRKKAKTVSWNITSDGKRIYFIDQANRYKGSWKILSLSELELMLSFKQSWGDEEEVITFARVFDQ